ncbi:hypothetical protein ACGE24_07965 [Corynebacterium kroppenstedtii]|uniref:hypothetical protein n=1 Tax=Corynebacterium sp. PCR 32 TaxID=3351342 RepID=UPI00309D0802
MSQPSTVISEKAVGRIVEQALASVPGCIHHASGLDRVTGRELPRWEIDLDTDNRAMSIVAQIAVQWPSPVTEVATSARQALHTWVERYTDIPVIKADVSVAAVVPGDTSDAEPTRVTSEDLAAREQEPTLNEITASPLHAHSVTTHRTLTTLVHPKPFGDITLTPVHVNRTTTELIHPQHTRIEPFIDVVAHQPPVRPVPPVHTRKKLAPISVERTTVHSPVTPQPIRPCIYPSADTTPVVHVNTSATPRTTDPIVTRSRPVESPLTPTPITPTMTPTVQRTPVTHLVGDIGPRRTAPIVVESLPMETVRAFPLKPTAPIRVRSTTVTHPEPSAQPVDQQKVLEALKEDERSVTRERRRERHPRKVRTVVSHGTTFGTTGARGSSGTTPYSPSAATPHTSESTTYDGSTKGQT